MAGATGEWLTVAVEDRTRVQPLLEWATTRPGQLGRGVPESAPRATMSGSLDLVGYTLLVILSLPMLIGGFMLVVIGLLSAALGEWPWSQGAVDRTYLLVMTTAFLAPIVLGGLLVLSWRALALAERRRASALEWLVP
ncbi:hypothetical protein [Ornithinimicrobium sp. Y1694]|uniref:hypothetical protein n=1 Tax=Ornithinimicrobium sp. Y1694 TaxID=3418590 RepID=UPI003CEF62D5